VAGWHVYPGPQSVAVTHGTSHCGTHALASSHVCPLSGVVTHSVPRSRSQAKPDPQSELLWQGSDTHVPAGPPSAATPPDSHENPIGQSEATEHARASACRGSKAVEANAKNERPQPACRVFIARPPYPIECSSHGVAYVVRRPRSRQAHPEGAALAGACVRARRGTHHARGARRRHALGTAAGASTAAARLVVSVAAAVSTVARAALERRKKAGALRSTACGQGPEERKAEGQKQHQADRSRVPWSERRK
jgi:hypothetical protein